MACRVPLLHQAASRAELVRYEYAMRGYERYTLAEYAQYARRCTSSGDADEAIAELDGRKLDGQAVHVTRA